MLISPSRIQPYLESEFPYAFELMLATGTHPSIRTALINPYTGQESQEWFGNIGDHAVVVGWSTQQLCKILCAEGAMNVEQCREATFRALIHDIGKPFEIFRRISGRDSTHAYHPEATADLLDKLISHGYDITTARTIVSAGSEVGHLSLALFIDGSQQDLTIKSGIYDSKVIFLSDAISSGSVSRVEGRAIQELMTSRSRVETPRFMERYPWMFKAGLSRDNDGYLEYVWDTAKNSPNVGSFADLQVRIARAISQEILEIAERDNFGDPESGVLSILNESYSDITSYPKTPSPSGFESR